MQELQTLKQHFPSVENEAECIKQLQQIKQLKRAIREIEQQSTEDIINYMVDENIKEIQIDDNVKIIKSEKKVNRFKTDYIYSALKFTDEQINVLPKNPNFRKSAILANEKVAIAHSEDITDIVVLKELDKKFIK